MHKNHHFISSLRNAINGIRSVFATEKNVRFHFYATILVILAAAILDLPIVQWLFLVLAISLVWITELLNTAMEYLFDVSQPEIDNRVKTGKDISAAAVLLAAIFSIVIGLLVFGPPLLRIALSLFR